MLRMNLLGPETFVLSIIPFDQIAIDFGCGPEARQFAGASGALQGTREDLRESQSSEPFPKSAGIAFATPGQRHIGKARMLACEAPGGFAVPRQINRWKNVAHVARSADRPLRILCTVDFTKRSLANSGLASADRASKSR